MATNKQSQSEPRESYYEIVESTKTIRETRIYISRGVDCPRYYIELITRLRDAQPEDVIYLHLNTPGGQLDTGVQIINAMRECRGTIVTVLDGTACSLGSFLFLAGHEFIVHDNARLMFHNYSGGTFGKGNEQAAQLSATIEWVEGLLNQLCYPFLSKQEIVDITQGKDLWMGSNEVRERLIPFVEYLSKQYEQEAKQLEEDAEELIYERVAKRKAKQSKSTRTTSKKKATTALVGESPPAE